MTLALAFGVIIGKRRPLTHKQRKQRDVCLCDSCCAYFPERLKLRREQIREVKGRFNCPEMED